MSIKEQIAKAAVKYHYLGEKEQRVVAFSKHQECYAEENDHCSSQIFL